MRTHTLILGILVAASALVCSTGLASASVAEIDKSFGTGGTVEETLVGNVTHTEYIFGAPGPAGASFFSLPFYKGTTLTPKLVKYTAAGARDKSFGVGGVVATSSGGIVQTRSNGSPVTFGGVAGKVTINEYTKVGKPDTTFGGTGQIILDLTSPPFSLSNATGTHACAARLNSDGSMYLSLVSRGGAGKVTLVKLLATGAADTSFGSGGALVLWDNENSAPSAIHGECPTAITVDSLSNIALLGRGMGSGQFYPMRITKVSSGGALDTSWDADGILDTTFGIIAGSSIRMDITVDLQSRVVVSANVAPGVDGSWTAQQIQDASVPSILRYLPTATLDATFANSGVFAIKDGAQPRFVAQSIKLLPLGGLEATGCFQWKYPGIMRLNDSGKFDVQFNPSGIISTPVEQCASQAFIAADNRFLSFGYMGGLEGKVAISRFRTDAADLTVTPSLTAGFTTATAKRSRTIQVKTKNKGPRGAERLTVTVAIPKKASFGTASGNAKCTKLAPSKKSLTRSVICRSDKLKVGSTMKVTISVKGIKAKMKAKITSSAKTPDTHKTNNSKVISL
jgi:uncharacterized delta-60 repeat protein